jgi:AraC-like DNA-binding protein
VAPLTLRLSHMIGASGIAHVFAGMLTNFACVMDSLQEHQLRPVELSLTEFLVACIATYAGAETLGGAASEKAAHFHRICQIIEAHLGDSSLTSQRVADMEGVSLRYLQKLFTEQGRTFVNYVRERRLARCKSDLLSPLYAQQAITQICFRWGFNSSAHFSRAFREQFHISPREFRNQKPEAAGVEPSARS